jgi:methionyl-tRNA formyltransferase
VIERQIRAMNPWPSAYTYYEGRLLKLWKAKILDIDGDIPDHDIEGGAPGTVISAESSGIDVLTGNGIVRILELQPEGKKRMETASFLRGHKMPEGSVLGER